MKFKGKIKERTPQRKMLLVVGGCIVLYLSIEQGNWFYVAVAVLLILAVFFSKEHVVDEKGVDIVYHFLGMTSHNLWRWDEISAMRPDFEKAAPDILMEINKGVTIRAFVFSRSDSQRVMEFAKEMNPDMYVDDRSEMERRAADAKHKQELANAQERARQAQKAKRNKKKK